MPSYNHWRHPAASHRASAAWMSCCRAPEGRVFRPYDLLVVARESLGLYDENFTVSANGVMTIRKGVQAEFVPLAEWVRQQSLFDSISAIGFYKNYITGRAFRRWHNVSQPATEQPHVSPIYLEIFGMCTLRVNSQCRSFSNHFKVC